MEKIKDFLNDINILIEDKMPIVHEFMIKLPCLTGISIEIELTNEFYLKHELTQKIKFYLILNKKDNETDLISYYDGEEIDPIFVSEEVNVDILTILKECIKQDSNKPKIETYENKI